MNLDELFDGIEPRGSMTPSEDARVRARIAAATGAEIAEVDTAPVVVAGADLAGDIDLVVVELGPVRSTAERPRLTRGPVLALAAAAAIVIAVLVVDFASGSRPVVTDSPPDSAPSGQPVDPQFEAVCRTEIDQLFDALERWNGIENWARAVNPDPDVAGLLVESLVALESIELHTAAALFARTTFEEALASRPDNAVVEEASARIALGQLRAIIESAGVTGSACSLDRIEAL